MNEANSTDDVIGYLKSWVERNFSIADGTETAQILNDYAQLTNVRKVEHMSYDIFAQYAYGDEGARRINRYADLYYRANRIYASLPENEKDAFYQLVLMKIHASYYINLEYYYADRSYLCHRDGKLSAANYYTELSRKADYYKREMLEHYNKKVAGGKWDRILTPEEYKPPVTALFPPRTPSLEKGEDSLGVVLWDHGNELCLDRYSVNPKWIELYNPGEGEIEYEIEAGEGIYASENVEDIWQENVTGRNSGASDCFGNFKQEMMTGGKNNASICAGKFKNEKRVFIDLKSAELQNAKREDFEGYVEADGYISIPADTGSQENNSDWRIIEHMGRGEGNAVEGKAGCLKYSFYLRQSGELTADIFRFPTLNSVGRIRAAVRHRRGRGNHRRIHIQR